MSTTVGEASGMWRKIGGAYREELCDGVERAVAFYGEIARSSAALSARCTSAASVRRGGAGACARALFEREGMAEGASNRLDDRP